MLARDRGNRRAVTSMLAASETVQGENRVLYRDGVPVAVQVAEEVKFVQQVALEIEWSLRNSLLRRQLLARRE